jgi:N-acetyl-anhydromuramyl-L-alanine amidase AmpD
VTLPIVRSFRLTDDQYHADPQTKNLIVLHHTVGGSAKGTIKYWQEDPRRIATAYLVERDGTVYEVFPPECWANHLGCKDLGLERRSIGIELASEGGLTIKAEGQNLVAYTALGAPLGLARELLRTKRVVRLDAPYRGFQWFDAYEPTMVDATITLVLELCSRFRIPRRIPSPAEWRGVGDLRKWFGYQGVLHHALLRPDKSDLHPLFPVEALQADLAEAEQRAA